MTLFLAPWLWWVLLRSTHPTLASALGVFVSGLGTRNKYFLLDTDINTVQ